MAYNSRSLPTSAASHLMAATAADVSARAAAEIRNTKYWAKRTELFSRYEDGIQLDTQLWYSVTPEWLAAQQAQRCVEAIGRGAIVVDAFAGAGGNTIQFACAGLHVVAIERDPLKLEMLRHNVHVYGVADRVTIVLGDFMQLVGVMKAAAVFLGPPWGGPEYTQYERYDIEADMAPYSATAIYEAAAWVSDTVIMYLPRHSKVEQVYQLAEEYKVPVQLDRQVGAHGCPGITAYMGKQIQRLEVPKQPSWRCVSSSSGVEAGKATASGSSGSATASDSRATSSSSDGDGHVAPARFWMRRRNTVSTSKYTVLRRRHDSISSATTISDEEWDRAAQQMRSRGESFSHYRT